MLERSSENFRRPFDLKFTKKQNKINQRLINLTNGINIYSQYKKR
ncbi:hypothetical protein HMPREF9418_1708 [Neisseria macacae ATCC 33926]|uniref:Uncharacterized protein n=1 Tax=Neisseria macacae ATCC 33926 TaxID=997348 RepID=A0AA36UJP8_9NEIS|nr:hypothetical protein HMPREF9418_1708 [Neisseria macacae ATCC 33926]